MNDEAAPLFGPSDMSHLTLPLAFSRTSSPFAKQCWRNIPIAREETNEGQAEGKKTGIGDSSPFALTFTLIHHLGPLSSCGQDNSESIGDHVS